MQWWSYNGARGHMPPAPLSPLSQGKRRWEKLYEPLTKLHYFKWSYILNFILLLFEHV